MNKLRKTLLLALLSVIIFTPHTIAENIIIFDDSTPNQNDNIEHNDNRIIFEDEFENKQPIIVVSTPIPTPTVTPTTIPTQTPQIKPTLSSTAQPIDEEKPLSGIKIGIDPGHQRHANTQRETISPTSSKTKIKVTGGTSGVTTGIPEYKTVLEISFKLKDILEKNGATVFMTRTSHDVDISNQDRAKMMNDLNVDLMLRIHCDGVDNRTSNGVALYTSESNSIAIQSQLYAEKILHRIVEFTNAKNNGIVVNDNYTGQNWATVPCIMIECGFMSNPTEDMLLNSDEYQEKIAKGITEGIIDCFKDQSEIQYNNYSQPTQIPYG